ERLGRPPPGSAPRVALAQDAAGRVAVAEEIPDLHRHAGLVLADLLHGRHERRPVLRLGVQALLEHAAALAGDLEIEPAQCALHRFHRVGEAAGEGLRNIPRVRRLVPVACRLRVGRRLLAFLGRLLAAATRDQDCHEKERARSLSSRRRRRHAGGPLPCSRLRVKHTTLAGQCSPCYGGVRRARTMSAKELLRAGKLTEAIDAQVQAVKAAPSDTTARIFLFELLAGAGDWERAAKHLDVVASQAPDMATGGSSYQASLRPERP